MTYTGEVRLILEKALEKLEQEGNLAPEFLKKLRKLYEEGKLQDESEIAKILEEMLGEVPNDSQVDSTLN